MKQDYQAKLTDYLKLKESLGFRSTKQISSRLRSFAAYLESHDAPVRAQFAVDWAASTGCGTPGKVLRLCIARNFLKYLRTSCPEIEIPPSKLFGAVQRPTPYIFSDAQIQKLMTATNQLESDRIIHPLTYRILLGLLACTGLRVGEAIRLSVSDMHLDESPARLHIVQTKFDESRWVPLHATTASELRVHLEQRLKHERADVSDKFLVGQNGSQLNQRTLHRAFEKLLRLSKIESQPGKRRPTLRSFRHTFAVRRLRAWYEAGSDTRSLLPILSVYLGHTDPTGTYWYLSATPELMETASVNFENYVLGGSGL
jgi:Site-specific recombinase XerD